MVFLVRQVLTAEDWTAGQRLIVYRNKIVQRERRRIVRDWVGTKLSAVVCLVFCVQAAVVYAKLGQRWLLAALLFFLIAGICMLAESYPAKQTDGLPGMDISFSDMPDTPVLAVFFEDGFFCFWEASEKTRLSYYAVVELWEDKERLYLFFREHPPLILRKNCLTGGKTPEEFKNFLGRYTVQNTPMRSLNRLKPLPVKFFAK